LYGKNVSGSANLMARADSEILVENRSPLNLRVYNMTVDADGGFVKYNGTYITKSADIGALNASSKTTSLTVDSIDTRGGGANQQLPTLTVKNTFVPLGPSTRGEDDALMMTAPDGTSANLYADEMRAPEMRVNGTLYNKLGTINLSNTAGSISVVSETAGYTPRLDGREITVTAGTATFRLSATRRVRVRNSIASRKPISASGSGSFTSSASRVKSSGVSQSSCTSCFDRRIWSALSISVWRRIDLRTTTAPAASTPTTLQAFLPRSTPRITIDIGPLLSLSSTGIISDAGEKGRAIP
jgi:hypothetical protein